MPAGVLHLQTDRKRTLPRRVQLALAGTGKKGQPADPVLSLAEGLKAFCEPENW